MKIATKLLVVAALAAPLSAFAQAASNLSYNYVEGGYTKATLDGGDANDFDFDGFSVNASGKVAKNVFLFGDYRYLESDTNGFGTKLQTNSGRVGLGFIIPVNSNFDLNAGGGVSLAKFDYKGPVATTPDDNDDTGYFVQGIARAKILPALEINGGYRYEKIFKESESTGLVGAVFNFTPALAAIGNYEFGDNTDRYVLGGRFNFGL